MTNRDVSAPKRRDALLHGVRHGGGDDHTARVHIFRLVEVGQNSLLIVQTRVGVAFHDRFRSGTGVS